MQMSELEGDNRDGLLLLRTDEDLTQRVDRSSLDHQTALRVPQARRRRIDQWERFKVYSFSPDGLELLFSAIILGSSAVAALIVGEGLDLIPPRQRAIPYQQLESTGEYILNQVYNESFQGETISST